MVEKMCKYCNKTFIPGIQKKQQKFCCKVCCINWFKRRYFKTYKKKIYPFRRCKLCNTLYKPKVNNQKFCSKNCSKEQIRIQLKIKKIITKQQKKKYFKIEMCKYCKNKFKKTQPNKIFCSINCNKLWYKENPTYIKKTIIKEKKYNINQNRKNIIDKKIFLFEKIYNYDKEDYSGNRIWCLIRDRFKCRKCNSIIRLNVHHIDGKGLNLSKNKRNNNLKNLITLCQNCHDLVEGEEITELSDEFNLKYKNDILKQLKL